MQSPSSYIPLVWVLSIILNSFKPISDSLLMSWLCSIFQYAIWSKYWLLFLNLRGNAKYDSSFINTLMWIRMWIFFNSAIKELFLTLENFWEQTLMALLYFLLKHLKLWMTCFKQKIIVFFFYSHVLTAENLSEEKISQLILQFKFLLLGWLSAIQPAYSISCRGKKLKASWFFNQLFVLSFSFLSLNIWTLYTL